MIDRRTVPLAELIERCQEQTLHYLRTQEQSDASYCLELFRRAVQDGDQKAWAFIYTFYSTPEFLGDHYLLKWIRSWLNGRHSTTIRGRYTEEEMVQEIWLRFMRSEAAQEFRFDDMRNLMAFLRRLTNNFALDVARRRSPVLVESSGNDGHVIDPEALLRSIPGDQRAMIDRIANAEAMTTLLSEIVGAIVKTEREWQVFQAYFLDELPPRKLYELYPDRFARGEVETIRTRLSRRLRKAPFLVSRYIKLIILEDDERQKLVFEYSLLSGWPDSQLQQRYPGLFPSQTDVLTTKTRVLSMLRTQRALLKCLNLPSPL